MKDTGGQLPWEVNWEGLSTGGELPQAVARPAVTSKNHLSARALGATLNTSAETVKK